MTQTAFDYVKENDLCLGCAACTQIPLGKSIVFHLDGGGFLRPFLTKPITQDEDREFAKVCPGLSVQHEVKNEYWTDLWGPVISSQVGWATDKDVRYFGSSGGGITAIASHLLSTGKVDAVLHVGVSETDPLLNVFKISVTPEQVMANTGSRYAPAAPLQGLNAALVEHSRIAVVGKPCDIAAARKLANTSDEVHTKILFFVSFMCAGVPSFKGTDAVLNKLDVNKEELREFRYRGNGWPGYATATLANGETRTMSYHDSWGKILNRHLQLRCKVCIDGTGEFADITFADAWHGGDEGYPDFEEKEGRSLILVRTPVGAELLDAAKKCGSIETEPLGLDMVEKMQPYQAVRKQLMLSRIVAMRIFGLRPPKYDLNNMLKLAVGVGVKKNLVSFLGMARRTLVLKRMKIVGK